MKLFKKPEVSAKDIIRAEINANLEILGIDQRFSGSMSMYEFLLLMLKVTNAAAKAAAAK